MKKTKRKSLIHKKNSNENKLRITSSSDIPEFLKDFVTIRENALYLNQEDGFEICLLGSTIGYMKNGDSYFCWKCE